MGTPLRLCPSTIAAGGAAAVGAQADSPGNSADSGVPKETFDFGEVHFIALDVETSDYGPDSPQMTWDSPTCSRTSSVASSTKERIVQSP